MIIYWYTAWSFRPMTFLAILLREKKQCLIQLFLTWNLHMILLKSGSPFPNTQCMVYFPYIYHNIYAKLKINNTSPFFRVWDWQWMTQKKSLHGPQILDTRVMTSNLSKMNYVVGGFTPFEKYAEVKWDHFPKVRVENNQIFELPPASEHLRLELRKKTNDCRKYFPWNPWWFKVPGSL